MTSKFELGVGGFCHTEHTQNDHRALLNQISYISREVGCSFRWNMQTDRPDVHTHTAFRKEAVLYRSDFFPPGN